MLIRVRWIAGILIAFAFVSVLVPADLRAEDASAYASRKPGSTIRARKCPDGRLLTLDTSCYDPSAVPPPRRSKKAKRSPLFLPVETVTPKHADAAPALAMAIVSLPSEHPASGLKDVSPPPRRAERASPAIGSPSVEQVLTAKEADKAEQAPTAEAPAQPVGKRSPQETVPGEVLEQVSADMHPKQEHVLKSLPAKSGWTVIPLPAFSYARNESYWAGALMPILRANEKEEIEDIFAPLYLHNKFINETFSLNYYGYRSETVQYRAVAAYATKVERHFELGFKNTGAGGGRYILAAEGNWFKNAFTRFFGIGNLAPGENETTYTARETNVRLSAGINLGEKFSVLWTERFRDVRVEDGRIPTLPQTKSQFPQIEGVAGAQLFAHRLSLLYDTRDNLLAPVRGAYVLHYWELGHNLIHNEADRWVRFALDARYLMPHASGRMVFVSRLFIDKVFSQGVPFYERPTLGGENTLRGFGLNRFVDDNVFLVNLEERIRVFKKRVFDNPIELEAAPFLDFGRVNNQFLSRLKRTQFNPGVGIRVISRPNVVGRLDVAYGKEGGNVFVGLDYPF